MKNIGPISQQPEYIAATKQIGCITDLHQWLLLDIHFEYRDDDEDDYDYFSPEGNLEGHRFIISCKNCGELRRLRPAEMATFTLHFSVAGYNNKQEGGIANEN